MTASSPPETPLPPPVKWWLIAVAALIALMVLVGGATRLTESGLSIVEWKPVTGTLPPLNEAQWAQAFEGYKTIPQYRELNAGMSLSEFKTIFWWEWSHRLLGRLHTFDVLSIPAEPRWPVHCLVAEYSVVVPVGVQGAPVLLGNTV